MSAPLAGSRFLGKHRRSKHPGRTWRAAGQGTYASAIDAALVAAVGQMSEWNDLASQAAGRPDYRNVM